MSNTITNHEDLKDLLQVGLHANVIPFITGSAGIGKSAIVAQLAQELNLDLIDLHISIFQ